ncbi:MAG: hypothetical protein A2Y10_04520 [Planctomycetes bacterium GWF2_41_51]|nr:MAG: hypothetical protein A2Y10_04520 [Planctomycetes bacterium GWF2_41_51]
MKNEDKSKKLQNENQKLRNELEELKIRLQEAEEALDAIRSGSVDALVVTGPAGQQIFTLTGEERIYRLLVETMNEGGFTANPRGQILFCNNRLSQMLKKPMEDIIGHHLEEFIISSQYEEMTSLLNIALVEPVKKRLVFLASDGSFVPALVSASPLKEPDSASICFVATDMSLLEASEEVIRQINEQKSELQKRALELQKLNRILRALSNSNQAMMKTQNETDFLKEICNIINTDCGYAMVTINYARDDEEKTVKPVAYAGYDVNFMEKLKISWADDKYGQGPSGIAIRTGKVEIFRNIPSDPRFEHWRFEKLKRHYGSAIGFPLKENEHIFGSLVLYSDELDPFSQDEVKLLQELANDLSFGIAALRSKIDREKDQDRLKQLSTELQRSNQELEQFANVISHDLREPLRAISGFVELLRMKYKDKLDETANEYINFSVSGAQTMKNMILGLIEYSRVQSQGQSFVSIDLNKIITAVVRNLDKSLTENKAEFTCDKLPEVKADEVQILRLFQNLIHNALKFKKENQNPKIHIACKRREKYWVFSVSDNGIGISEDFKIRIFTLFQREHKKSNSEGDGIGLAVCKRIVERHGGKIWLESQPDIGSTFFFTIPD